MYEQSRSPEEAAEQRQDAIEVGDFVYAATGSRVRRVTLPDGTHWFPAKDVASGLGYSNPRQAIRWHVEDSNQKLLGDIAPGGYGLAPARKGAAQGLRTTMKMVNLQGLINLVNGCTKPECQPFRNWVAEVIATIQRDGSYALEPAPVQPVESRGTAYVMPPEVIDVIVRLEERNVRADELLAAAQTERAQQVHRTNDLLDRIAGSLETLVERMEPRVPVQEAPEVTPQQLLDTWRQRNLVVTDDVHAVAAYLAPALVRGAAGYTVETIAMKTGLPQARVHDCLRLLLKRGCMKQRGVGADGAPVYVLP
ncbi:DNA-binding protein [Streptomyces spiroverticillatus]|uniref:DNA-binding protein n=1 Tax=Streptomyces finlayi TaxID=67296 RepID=A0A918WUL0_9ACTN|nr:Bro-N domain-containing protein [Streptomyces finlayi]GGZ99923.1 DNA-binding protein [Streptomyces spiroverticillatus]GHC84524.1 DNA-binding protein [Streptomyces finlayi]